MDNPFLYDQARRMLPSGQTGPILAWIKECVAEGEALMQADPIWTEIDRNQEYVSGRQRALSVTQDRPPYVSHTVVNETRRTHRRHVSALTDVKPVYAFRTANPNFQSHALLLNNLTTVWWINTFADLSLADAVSYAFAGGSGDLVLEYNPFYGPMGDMVLYPRDARDTIPIRPSRTGGVQTWFGVILREAHSYNVLAATYPQKLPLLKQSASPWGSGIFTKIRSWTTRITGGGATSTLSGLSKTFTGQQAISGNEVLIYKTFLSDPSINTTDQPILMGNAGTSWAYTVQPGDRLYPQKRLIVTTEAGILYDGPSPYWHGMFPVARLKLMSVPWSFFGLPLCDVQIGSGLQDATNDVLNAMLDKVRQRNRPPMVGNAKVPEPMLRTFDPLNPRARLRTNEQMGTGLQIPEIPDLPNFTLDLWQALRSCLHDLTGDSSLDALQQAAANQSFDPESIEAWMNAMSPEMKLEGRQVELCLREVAEMQRSNIFQFYDLERRMTVLGDAGMTLQDFDYDPKNLIPAMKPGDKGYLPQLDVNNDKTERAQFFLKLFTFYLTPNSLLALNANAEKLKYVMLFRAGVMDIWSLAEKLEIANYGDPPTMPLPIEPQPHDPKELAAIQAGMVPNQWIDPQTGMVLTVRKPISVTERLMAQQMLGLGQTVSPVGQKASAQTGPAVDVQDNGDGTKRIKMVESKSSHHPTMARRAQTAAQ
ncbi:MAG TPA: hypothetical protein VFO16_24230 [Pseudonocardiaceae bacterium]|nr:hypothetical protein [Pseudonocardiaceae bacterium]